MPLQSTVLIGVTVLSREASHPAHPTSVVSPGGWYLAYGYLTLLLVLAGPMDSATPDA